MTTLSPLETAQARSASYRVFSQLFDAGVTEEARPYLRSIRELSAAAAELVDPDLAAAVHQQLFGFNVFAHESMFLSPDALLGGPVSERVVQFMQRAGFDPGNSQNADHIARELALLAFLCAAEADARRDGQAGEISGTRALQRSFLNGHLLRWLPGLTLAIRQQEEPFYAALAGLTLELALDHRTALGDNPLNADTHFALPAAPDLLSNQQAGLSEVAATLLITVHSGIYLSRDDISQLGRQHNLPTGFGSRRIMLTNLLRSAAEFDAIGALTESMLAIADRWQAGYSALIDHPAPAVQAIGQAWSQRVASTNLLLSQLAEAASSARTPTRPHTLTLTRPKVEYEDE